MYQITLGSRENGIVKALLGFNTITHRPLKFRVFYELLRQSYVDDNTVLYIPMYGDNPFEDKSRNAYQVTNYNVTAVTDEHPAKSKGAARFTDTNQYLYLFSSPFNGLTTFTLEFDYMFTSIPTGNGWQPGYYFASNGPDSNADGLNMRFCKTQIEIGFYSDRSN